LFSGTSSSSSVKKPKIIDEGSEEEASEDTSESDEGHETNKFSVPSSSVVNCDELIKQQILESTDSGFNNSF
jgi:hypothetical protein